MSAMLEIKNLSKTHTVYALDMPGLVCYLAVKDRHLHY